MLPLLIIAIFAPFVWLPVTAFAGRWLGSRTAWFALVAPVVSTVILAALALDARAGAQTVVEIPWIPSLGLNLTFLVDGLSLFFALVVSGMGVLVALYAAAYLDDHYEWHGRFYAYLLLFMGAMLGTVLAGNLLLLFVFWELTGIASFLLIGFLHDKEESRSGARMALLVTGLTGLVMLAGVALTGIAAGTWDLATLLAKGGEAFGPDSRGLLSVAFVLLAVGAMGKSAQFPFHFWLPNAMAAPTPVSAYLHSATMVKLGVFFVARVFPIFSDADLWMPLLVTVGFGTMALASLFALLSHDLKAILAWSTVTTLGMLIGFYGMGSRTGANGVQGDLLHVASHVFFKGALFMCAGIIDHATGTRDVRELGGLRRRLPWLAVVVTICAASMAGVPGTLGFVSKEYFLKAQMAFLAQGGGGGWAIYAVGLAWLALTLKVAFSARLVAHVFWGPLTPGATEHFHAPARLMLVPPAILAVACVLFGVWPAWLGAGLDRLGVTGLQAAETLSLHALPSQWAPEVGLSLAALVIGGGVFAVLGRGRWARLSIPRWLRLDLAFEAGVEGLSQAAKRFTVLLRSDRPFDYLPIVMMFVVVLIGTFVAVRHDVLLPTLPSTADFDPLRTYVAGLIAVAALLVLALRSWSGQLIAMSIVGFLVTFYFVLFQAPDLAMTQILVESATLLLVLVLLSRFPKSAEAGESAWRKSRQRWPRMAFRGALATGMGLIATLVTLLALQPKHPEFAGNYYLENTRALAHGTNAVNTILVDFRGLDTMFEITVLVIACLSALGLLMRYRRTRDEYAAGSLGLPGYSYGARFEKHRTRKEEQP
ncbi:hydrogen gas-evolving membrane-bound hydrogenase subunit E [Geminisphaera colitermitum]|uniref:hydrogen gas-evolving membrane-bound hydrogenase subunit E n=1 Tax=Geminisphaera colitermitum TaxID=1148786 RepID=UPI000158C7DC|nr:hydrogen gas-evolving membrane-bound hydrogenase subunit E [Geminisphaera colitermitum]